MFFSWSQHKNRVQLMILSSVDIQVSDRIIKVMNVESRVDVSDSWKAGLLRGVTGLQVASSGIFVSIPINLLFQGTSSTLFCLFCFYFRQEPSCGLRLSPVSPEMMFARPMQNHIFQLNSRFVRERFGWYIPLWDNFQCWKKKNLIVS